MKKFFMIAVMAVAALSASAQVYVGGNIGFSSDKANSDAKATNKFTIAPEAGYTFSDKMAAGIQLGFTTEKHGDADAMNTFQVAPYARYTFCKSGAVDLFVDGGIIFEAYGSDSGSSFGVGLRPGIAFNASEKVAIIAKTGYLGYQFANKDAGEWSKFAIGLDNAAVSFGVFYKF